ncbi:helix-turn-helix domain-containing protein [Candidatus Zixiibacteriota bacterium]
MPSAAFGDIIRFHRKKSGLSQRELADLAEVGSSSVYELERSKMTVRFETLLKVCAILNISIEFASPLMSEFHSSESR